jgi:hypothetical protein
MTSTAWHKTFMSLPTFAARICPGFNICDKFDESRYVAIGGDASTPATPCMQRARLQPRFRKQRPHVLLDSATRCRVSLNSCRCCYTEQRVGLRRCAYEAAGVASVASLHRSGLLHLLRSQQHSSRSQQTNGSIYVSMPMSDPYWYSRLFEESPLVDPSAATPGAMP